MAVDLFAPDPNAPVQPDIFAGAFSQPVGPGSPFGGVDLFAAPGAAPPPPPGIISSILGEIKRDFVGAAKVVGAGVGAPFHALGLSVPVTLDDINRRDVLGAAMTATLFAGGAAIKGAQGLALGARAAREGKTVAQVFKSLPAFKKAGLVAAGEAATGAAFGVVKGMVEDENVLSESIKQAATFGLLGGGFQLGASATRATVHGLGRLAGVQNAKSAIIGDIAKREAALAQLREFSGVRLRAPETGTSVSIQRLSSGKVQLHNFNADATRATTQEFSDFNTALREALTSGHVENMGPARTKVEANALQAFDEGILETLADPLEDIPGAVGSLELQQYKAVQDFARANQQENQLLSWLGFESMSEQVGQFGTISLKPAERDGILRILAGNKAQLAKLDDSGLVKEALQQGKLSLENLAEGANMREYMKEIFMNDRVIGDSVVYAAMPAYDVTFMAHVMTPRTLAKLHPEIRPLQQMADASVQAYSNGAQQAKELLDFLQDKIPTAKADKAARIIDASQSEVTVQAARAKALREAAATGDDQVIEFVERVTSALNTQRLKLVAAGRLGRLPEEVNPALVSRAREIIARATGEATGEGIEERAIALATEAGQDMIPVVEELLSNAGLSGYFPIRHFTGNWRLQAHGAPAGTFRTAFNSREEALAEFRRIGAENPNVTGTVLPQTYGFDGSTTGLVDGAEWGKLTAALRRAEGMENLTAAEAGELLQAGGTQVASGGKRKFSPHLQERKLGIRDFTEDPYRSLEFYLYNTERALAFNTFERDAARIIGEIPSNKSQLTEWAQSYTDLLLGRPTRAEQVVQNVAEAFRPGEVSPRVLKKYSAAIRRFIGFSRLGGALSGIVNLSQIAVNTAPIIGTRWTGVGIQKMMTPSGMREIRDKFGAAGIDLGLHMPLTREGELAGGESIRDLIRSSLKRQKIGEPGKAAKRGVEAFERMWLFAFNGTEKMNRLATAWGAYQKGLRELNMADDAALRFAAEQVQKTQFDYSLSNIPTALQGPLGGLIGQFKTFFINEMELIAGLDNKTRAKMLLAFSATGGLATLTAMPGADLLDAASGLVFDRRLSEALRSGGEENGVLTRSVVFGLPGLIGADLSRHVGPGGVMDLTRGWAGPAVSDAVSFGPFLAGATRDITTAGTVTSGTYNALFQRVIPSQVRRAERAWGILDTGEVRNPYSNKLIYRPQDRMRAAAVEAIGFPTTEMAAERALDDAVQRQITRYREVRGSYGRKLGLARGGEVGQILREARGRGFEFTPSDIRRWQKEMQKTGAERREARTPVDLRVELEGLF